MDNGKWSFHRFIRSRFRFLFVLAALSSISVMYLILIHVSVQAMHMWFFILLKFMACNQNGKCATHTDRAHAVETHKVQKGIHNQSLSVSRCAKYNNAMHCLHWFINTCASTRNIYFNKVILHCSVRFCSMLHGAREIVLLRVVWRRTRTELIYECNIFFIKLNRK